MSNHIIYIEKDYHTLKSLKQRPICLCTKKIYRLSKKIREIFEEFDDEDDGNKTIH